MKALGILSALFAGLNGIDDFQGAPQTQIVKPTYHTQKLDAQQALTIEAKE